jgi:hypothetical protein
MALCLIRCTKPFIATTTEHCFLPDFERGILRSRDGGILHLPTVHSAAHHSLNYSWRSTSDAGVRIGGWFTHASGQLHPHDNQFGHVYGSLRQHGTGPWSRLLTSRWQARFRSRNWQALACLGREPNTLIVVAALTCYTGLPRQGHVPDFGEYTNQSEIWSHVHRLRQWARPAALWNT